MGELLNFWGEDMGTKKLVVLNGTMTAKREIALKE